MKHAELRAAMIERFIRIGELSDIFAAELVGNALAMMPDRAGEFPVGSIDESGRLVTYERRFTVRVAVPHGEDLHTFQRARVDLDLDGYPLNSIKVDSNTEAIGEVTREILQQLIRDAMKLGIDQPESRSCDARLRETIRLAINEHGPSHGRIADAVLDALSRCDDKESPATPEV